MDWKNPWAKPEKHNCEKDGHNFGSFPMIQFDDGYERWECLHCGHAERTNTKVMIEQIERHLGKEQS